MVSWLCYRLCSELNLGPEALRKAQEHSGITYDRMLQRKKRKMQRLKRQETRVKMDAVLNLRDRKLTEDELYVLALGLNFQPVLATPPVIDIISATEVLQLKVTRWW